jgi:Glycoside Hydrolase Family 113
MAPKVIPAGAQGKYGMDIRDLNPTKAAEVLGQRPVSRERIRWIKTWLACVAFYYPSLWLSVSCVMAAPSLLRMALLGDHLEYLRLNAFGVMARSGPSHLGAQPYRSAFVSASSPWNLVLLLALIAAVLAVAGWRNHLLSGLAIAMLADVALVLPLGRFGESRKAGAPFILASLFFFALLCFGLRWMLSDWRQKGYWLRAWSLYAGFVLLPLPVWIVFHLFQRFHYGPPVSMLSVPPAAAALLVSFQAPNESSADPHAGSWRQPLSGLVATGLLAIGITWGGPALTHAFEQHQLDANRAAIASLPPIPENAPYPKVFFQKGVSFSAEFPDPYASAGARRMLRSIQKDGVNAVALIPYGGMQLGSPEVHGFGRNSWESEEGLRELSRLAHALGIKVMLKPGIWVRGGHFAGDVDFSSQADREKWFDEYGDFVVRYARFATEIHADVFSVGGEFIHLTPYAFEWRKIIARVRKVYPGPLTYAANFGGEFETLSFWDALDYMGLQEYYPLPDNLSTSALLQTVEGVQKKYQKPVIFTEAGFPSMDGANRHPWEDSDPGKIDLNLQARCYEAIYRAFYDKPWFEGMYWWKVGSNGFGGPDDTSLTPWGKPAMAVIRKWYVNGGR